jgi:hypothetical protein
MKDEFFDNAEMVELALEMCRTKHAHALSHRSDIDSEIADWERKIAKYEAMLPDQALQVQRLAAALHTPSGRVRHGKSEQLITTFLAQQNGSGASIREMSNLTGTKYPTVHRVIKILAERGQVRRDEQWRWHLVTK